MNEFIKAILLGIVEGLTEFIPVSSTGHLILVGDWLNFESANVETFNIAIQLGAILAVVILYKHIFLPFLKPKNWFNKSMNTILIAITPALLSGFLFYSIIKEHLFSAKTVMWALFVGGIIMILVDKIKPKDNITQAIEDITFKQAFIIGIAQCASLWPGMSRSGSCMVGGLLAKCDHKTAADFSFIIAVPVMLAAVGYDLLKSWHSLTIYDFQLISIGFITSFCVGYIAIINFLKLLKKYKLKPFGFYRILLSGVLFWVIY